MLYIQEIRHEHVDVQIHPHPLVPLRIDPMPPTPVAVPQQNPVEHAPTAPHLQNNPTTQCRLRRSERIRRVPDRLSY